MKKALIITALATLLAAPAFAEPVEYTVERTHTYTRFIYTHFGLSKQIMRFNETTGTVTYDAEAKTGAVDITIDTTSVDTGSDVFDNDIQGEDLLDTANHPTATFKSTKVNFEGDAPSTIEGDLTIKGITKPVTLTVVSFKTMDHPMLKVPALGANATATILRSDFDAGKHAPAVSDEVELDIAFEGIAK